MSNNSVKLSVVSNKPKDYEEFTKEDFQTQLSNMETQMQTLQMENLVFEQYLLKKDPDSLVGLKNFIDFMLKKFPNLDCFSTASLGSSQSGTEYRRATKESGSDISPLTVQSKQTLLEPTEGQLVINVLYLMEIVDNELERKRQSLEDISLLYNNSKFHLEAEKENMKLQIAAITEKKKQLELFITNNTERRTGKIHVEKFIRHIEKGLKKKDQEIRKTRLKTTAMHRIYRRLKSQKQHKLELTERLHPIDIEKLKIENKEQELILEGKTQVLYKTKHTAGKIGQNLIATKSKLNNEMVMLKGLTQECIHKEQKLKKLNEENEAIKNTLVTAENENKRIKNLVQTFRAPEVLDYVKMKVEVNELNNATKVWDRRCNNQQLTQSLLSHRLRQTAVEKTRTLASHLTQNKRNDKRKYYTTSLTTDENFSTRAVAS